MIHTTITLDEKIKKISEQKAHEQNMSLSSVLRILLSDYANGRIEIGSRIVKDQETSPCFSTGKDAIEWLRSEESDKMLV